MANLVFDKPGTIHFLPGADVWGKTFIDGKRVLQFDCHLYYN